VRIVSLLPSATEILFAVGAGDSVVGVTFECDFPPEARERRIVSNTSLTPGLTPAEIDEEVRRRLAEGLDLYTLDEGALRDIDPDLVVTQDLCAVCAVDITEVDAALEHLGCHATVVTLDPMTLTEVLESVTTIGRATGSDDRATEVVRALQLRLDRLSALVAGRDRPRMAVLEWTDPLFSAGHWVPDMVAAAGGTCVLGNPGTRSVTISPEALAGSGAEIVIVSPCGFNLTGATELARALMASGVLPPAVPVWAVDADAAFVRPGPRLVDGVEALAAIFHPEVSALAEGLAVAV